jgi:DNA polymerase-3 subunit gamma/tau
MSNPEPDGNRSLEQILATIRESLAEEAADPPAQTPVPASGKTVATPAAVVAAPRAAAQPAPSASAEPAPGASARPAKAATPAAVKRDDEDLADLFETKPSAPAAAVTPAPAPAAPDKPADAPADLPKDPLWFLSKRPMETAGDVPAAATPHETPVATIALPGEEGAKLSRPETLRGTLPPLFESGKEAETTKSPAVSRTPEAPAAPLAAPSPPKGGNGQAPAEVGRKAPIQATEAPMQATPDKPTSAASAPVANGRAGPIATAAAPASGEAAATQVRAFEQAIAHVLEPVLRKWLDDNLPRMVQAAIREELAKAAKATDAPAKE